ncbi:hypothetical protein, partial [Flavobacterium sp.]|uniref:hypothetical protein n=1 Tax=Flavobacterium sp. TaxID=239 RepID=UPI0037BE46BD
MYFLKGFSGLFKFVLNHYHYDKEDKNKVINIHATMHHIKDNKDTKDTIHIQDIEDMCKKHIVDDIQWQNITEEFKNMYETLKTRNDVDRFKKYIQKQYKYTLSHV